MLSSSTYILSVQLSEDSEEYRGGDVMSLFNPGKEVELDRGKLATCDLVWGINNNIDSKTINIDRNLVKILIVMII